MMENTDAAQANSAQLVRTLHPHYLTTKNHGVLQLTTQPSEQLQLELQTQSLPFPPLQDPSYWETSVRL